MCCTQVETKKSLRTRRVDYGKETGHVGTFWIWFGSFVFESVFSLAYFLCKVIDRLSFFVHPKRLLRAMACVRGANNAVMQYKVNRSVKEKWGDSWFEPVALCITKSRRAKQISQELAWNYIFCLQTLLNT